MVHSPKIQIGFTLLELVLVLFILAVLTTTGLSFIESEDGQLRFQQSMERFKAIEIAMLDEKESRGSAFLSGFTIDNGALPGVTNLDGLTSDDTTWSDVSSEEWVSYGFLRPYYFDKDNNETQLPDEDIYKLGKGFRGPYIRNFLDSDNELKDGWGFDYVVSTASSSSFVYTFDSSNTIITSSPYSIDTVAIEKTIDQNDWSILPSSLNITVTNLNDGNGDESLRLAVMVFVNSPVNSNGSEDADLWKTFYFDVTLSDGNSTNSSSETWLTNSGNPNIDRVPAGEHLVLLLDTTATITNPADDVIEVARLTVFPGATTQPEITLEAP